MPWKSCLAKDRPIQELVALKIDHLWQLAGRIKNWVSWKSCLAIVRQNQELGALEIMFGKRQTDSRIGCLENRSSLATGR